jgi:ATP-dependent helicase/nuclease subunit A
MQIPDDSLERERAATTFDRNVVVTAGAGTGKTTLLVDRLIHLVLREADPVRITEIVALTFTKKAAAEIRLRLRERLQTLLDLSLENETGNPSVQRTRKDLLSLMDRYHLNKGEVDRRSRDCLRNLERSEIGTIHSFAGTLLRLFPLEAGLDPHFQEDDGERFERYFEEHWDVWLDQELSSASPRRDRWKRVLNRIPLAHLRELSAALCSENIPLTSLAGFLREGPIPVAIRDPFRHLVNSANVLLEGHPGERQVERLLRAAARVIQALLDSGDGPPRPSDEDRDLLLTSNRPAPPKGWDSQEMDEALGVIRVAGNLLRIEPEISGILMDILLPFVRDCREGFLKTGFISFDGLLIRARDLVRDHPDVREELKRRFKAVLVDEFQDTDPLQYEILLYLAEQPGHRSRHWRDIRLTPGKIFVVGDPKQSIYAFRRADIEAYLYVVRDVIEGQDGIHCSLTTNFRSHEGILKPVNGICDALIRPRPGLQPDYVGIHPSPDREGSDSGEGSSSFPFRGVKLRLVQSGTGEMDAHTARRLEGESLARWLSEEVLGKAVIFNKEGQAVPVRSGDVALLMRTLTHAHHYLEPLRRRGIRFVVEGEKHFYATQEVIDAVNLLRTVDNPFDTVALVGILRSPVGGCEDRRIYDLHRRGLLDYRIVAKPENPAGKGLEPEERELYGVLCRLHETTPSLPVGEAVSRIFDETFLLLTAAHSFHGEQAVSNLEKIRQIAAEMGQEGAGTLKEVIARLTRRVDEVAEEGESALSEETVDAVKIMSVHKAKGLEFPVVILAGCHGGMNRDERKSVEVHHDWSTGTVGLRVGDCRDLPSIALSEKKRLREIEEEKRVLYVAMTRAREHLTLSGAVVGKTGTGSFLSMIREQLTGIATEEGDGIVTIGEGRMEWKVVTETLQPIQEKKTTEIPDSPDVPWASYVAEWKQRFQQYELAVRNPYFATPTLLKQMEEREYGDFQPGRPEGGGVFPPALLGQWAHRFLQEWDFENGPDMFAERLSSFYERYPCPDVADMELFQSELNSIFKGFFKSDAYRELQRVQILGREIPFLFRWEGQILEGVIDLLYEKQGELYIADYKTDKTDGKDPARIAESYRHPIRIYTEAVRRSLHREPAGFHLIFLRTGEMIPC